MTDASNTPLIVAEGLTRIYPLGSPEVIGVENIDLRIAPGELVVLKGNNGSGKSTTWKRFTTPTRTTILF